LRIALRLLMLLLPSMFALPVAEAQTLPRTYLVADGGSSVVVGTFWGLVFVIERRANGTCNFVQMAMPVLGNGISVSGGSGNDRIVVANSPTTICDATLEALAPANASSVFLFGFGGHDILVGKTTVGGSGDDVLVNSGADAFGEGGNDVILAMQGSQRARGDDGDDLLCDFSSRSLSVADGGLGNDRYWIGDSGPLSAKVTSATRISYTESICPNTLLVLSYMLSNL
jgi:hypothetical protein